MFSKKSVLKRILIGFKKANSIPTLPDHIIKLQAHPTIRVFRVIGGISFLTMISKNLLNYNIYLYIIVYIVSIVFTIYQFYILYFRFKQFITILKSDKLEVRK
jgi:hypothetical protein